jgi:hypothetical protein
VDARLRTIIDRAMQFDLGQVSKRYAQDHHSSPEEGQLLARELKRFLILRAFNPDIPYGITGKVDDMWHTFILFTREYARFCDEVAGTFLHHTPGVNQNARQVQQFRSNYANLFKDYAAVFGEGPDERAWPSLYEIRKIAEKMESPTNRSRTTSPHKPEHALR